MDTKESIEVQYGGDSKLIPQVGGSKGLAEYIWYLYSQRQLTGGKIADVLNGRGFLNSQHRAWGRTTASFLVKQFLGHTLTKILKPRKKSEDGYTKHWASQDEGESEAGSTMELVEYACTLQDLKPSKRLEMVRRLVA